MQDNKEYIKSFIKEHANNLDINKIKVISSYGHYKIFYNADFICFFNNDNNNNKFNEQTDGMNLVNTINQYNETLKKKMTHCILCITNTNDYIISYIIEYLYSLKYIKIIIVGSNSKYINHGIKLNIDYIVSPSSKYGEMIQTGLTYIKNSLSFGENILVTNTETIVHSSILLNMINNNNKIYGFSGPSNTKLIEISPNKIETFHVEITEKLFLLNWFVVNKSLLKTLNWLIFDNSGEIYNCMEAHIKKTNCKILRVNYGNSLYFGTFATDKRIKKEITNKYNKYEYQILNTFNNQENPYVQQLTDYLTLVDGMDLKAQIVLPKVAIEIDKPKQPDELLKIYTSPIHVINKPNEIIIKNTTKNNTKNCIDKFYFIYFDMNKSDIEKHISNINNIKELNYTILDGDIKTRINNHIIAIKDALTRKYTKIMIVENRLISKELIQIMMGENIFPQLWDLVLLFPEKNNINNTNDKKLIRLDITDEKIINMMSNFAYCLHHTIFQEAFDWFQQKNNIHNVLSQINKKNNSYVYYDDFNNQNLLINKPGKQILDKTKLITINQTIQSTPANQVTMVDNKIIQSLWIGESLSLKEILCIMSFIKNGHEFHLYIYDPVNNNNNIPKECIVKDANEILPKSEMMYNNENNEPAMYTEMFKYKLLFDRGGYWINMDMICFKNLNFTDAYIFSSDSSHARNYLVNSSIIKCPKGSDFAGYCYLIHSEIDKNKIELNGLDQKIINESIQRYKLLAFIKPSYYFAPIPQNKLKDIITPTTMRIEKDWYCLNLWNDLWEKNNMDKNKVYYGSLFGNAVKKYCDKYVSQEIFNLEAEYGKYNKSCVLFYWMPKDDDLINEMETLLQKDKKDMYDINKNFIHKDHAIANKDKISKFMYSDIYVYIFVRFLELGLIDNLHIVFGMAKNDKYLYNNEPLFTNGNFYNYNDKICLWKLNDMKSLFSFANAKLYFYKGYGNYEHFYSMLGMISPNAIFLRYLATALPYIANKPNNITIDDHWIDTYAQNNICRKKVKNFSDYFQKNYTKYDLLYIDTIGRESNYKKLFINVKQVAKLNKFSLMEYDEKIIKTYDLLFCASDQHPSKNWDIFYNFLNYCDKNKKFMSVLIITPIVSSTSLQKYHTLKNIQITIKKGLSCTEMNQYYNLSKNLLITFGRDANPRVMSESLSCGCFNIVLDILSDGKDVIENNPVLGRLIKISQQNISYEASYKSVKCTLTADQYNEIYNLITLRHDHVEIANTFKTVYDKVLITNNMYNQIKSIEAGKRKLVVTLATENYSNNLNYLLSSIKNTNPNQMVLIYYVGWKDTLLNDFKNAYPDYNFKEYELQNYIRADIIKLKVKLQHQIYFEYKVPFIWIDADSIVLKDLSPIYNKIADNTLICYYRPKEAHYMKFAVGVIAFGLSDNKEAQDINESFITKYYENSKKTKGHTNWFYDQTSLYETYNEHHIKLYPLNETEHSINDNINTIVYSRRNKNKRQLKDILQINNIHVAPINFDGISLKYD